MKPLQVVGLVALGIVGILCLMLFIPGGYEPVYLIKFKPLDATEESFEVQTKSVPMLDFADDEPIYRYIDTRGEEQTVVGEYYVIRRGTLHVRETDLRHSNNYPGNRKSLRY